MPTCQATQHSAPQNSFAGPACAEHTTKICAECRQKHLLHQVLKKTKITCKQCGKEQTEDEVKGTTTSEEYNSYLWLKNEVAHAAAKTKDRKEYDFGESDDAGSDWEML